jgi:hypothetical protein
MRDDRTPHAVRIGNRATQSLEAPGGDSAVTQKPSHLTFSLT